MSLILCFVEFDKSDLIDRITFRRLDGTRPGRLKIIRTLYEKKFCRPRGMVKKTALSNNDTAPPKAQAISLHVPEDQLSCPFVYSEEFLNVATDYIVSFKFRIGCVSPRNVDSKAGWTIVGSFARQSTQDIRLVFKTHDGAHPRDEFVPLSSIEPNPPSAQPDQHGFVIKGEHFGKIVYPRYYAKNAKKQRVGMYCTFTEKAKKKEAVLFPLDSIIRIRHKHHGPVL